MIFPTVEFGIFFTVVLALSWALMPYPVVWKPFILIASYIFYGAAGWKFCVLLAFITLANQAAAKLLMRTDAPRRRKAIVSVAVAVDLGVLGVFKYYGFFATQINDVLERFGLGFSAPLVALAIPLGVSFFTFQAISYTVDVYRRTIAAGSLLDVALYLSFFSHIVAGPIVRAREFLPQLATPRSPRDVPVGAAVGLIALGLIKKVMIADYLARTVVDPVFAVPQAYHAPDVALASYAYAAQIFCDFSGYTDIAIGTALLMGFVFPQNFHRPYGALGFQQFWRRWHMTLSRFLRDFLYIPLGGSRGGPLFTARNLMLTMLLGGLWHGAAWTFVLWGALHGAALVAERFFTGWERLPAWLRWLITFHVVVLAWILFRSPDLSIAGDVLHQLTSPGAATLWTFPAVFAVVAVIGLQLVPERWIENFRLRVEALHPLALGFGLAAVIVIVGSTVPSEGVPPFIYFRF
jgi:D-alanyl-lipoteichoic acid acyltransferase DltB (MBOAT superfamily)